jgi:hypothetical protein
MQHGKAGLLTHLSMKQSPIVALRNRPRATRPAYSNPLCHLPEDYAHNVPIARWRDRIALVMPIGGDPLGPCIGHARPAELGLGFRHGLCAPLSSSIHRPIEYRGQSLDDWGQSRRGSFEKSQGVPLLA